MTQTVDGVAIPASMAYRASEYNFPEPPLAGKNGRKLPVEPVTATSLTWVWDRMTQAEWDWWRLTIIGGDNRSLVCDCRLVYPKHRTEVTFTNAVVYAPAAGSYHNGIYFDVTVFFDNLIDTTWYLDSGEFLDDGLFLM